MKEIAYLLFAFFYRLACRKPIVEPQVFCVAMNDPGPYGNVGLVAEELKKRGYKKQVVYEGLGSRNLFRLFFHYPKELAKSSIILLDNEFMPLSYLSLRKESRLIQLWHGTGSIKKFGLDSDKGRLAVLEKKANENITALIVNGEGQREQYAHAFGIPKEKVLALGLPRTDGFFRTMEEERKGAVPKKKEKFLLYAPTFRDDCEKDPAPVLDLEKLLSLLPEEWTLGVRLHPFVSRNYQVPTLPRLRDCSGAGELTPYLLEAEGIITDYSSLVFDYGLLQRPMYFFAPDLEAFSQQGRGFYENYETFAPGPISHTVEELARDILAEDGWKEKRKAFIQKYYAYTDGNSTKRVADYICKKG